MCVRESECGRVGVGVGGGGRKGGETDFEVVWRLTRDACFFPSNPHNTQRADD